MIIMIATIICNYTLGHCLISFCNTWYLSFCSNGSFIISENFILLIDVDNFHLETIQRHHLSPQHNLDSKSQSSNEWEYDGSHEAYKEGKEGPDCEHEEEDDDDQHVRHHPGDEQEMFIEHGTKKEEEREE